MLSPLHVAADAAHYTAVLSRAGKLDLDIGSRQRPDGLMGGRRRTMTQRGRR
jgi:hypothetical protein